MSDIQTRVNKWQAEAFGGQNTFEIIRHKLAEEISELASAVWPGEATFVDPAHPVAHRDNIAEESADVVIVLLGLAKNQGFNLLEEVEKKLQINRKRTWKGMNHEQST